MPLNYSWFTMLKIEIFKLMRTQKCNRELEQMYQTREE